MMIINRETLLEELYKFSLANHGIVVGKPGIGKSYLLRQLKQRLLANDILCFIIRIDNTFDASDSSIETELRITQDWVHKLQQIQLRNEHKAVLIFDAFDAARDENLRRGFLTQIKKAKRELSEKWHIIVSARTYDASKSPELMRLFPTNEHDDEIFYCRKMEVGELTQEEIFKAIEHDPALRSFYDGAGNELREILAVPFFLLLLHSIIHQANTTELAEIGRYRSETQLLRKYWQKKVVNVDEHIEKERLLATLTNRLVESRTLTTAKQEFFDSMNPFPIDAFRYLRSENLIDEVSLNGSRVAFSHNIFFDYAVSRLALTELPGALLGFIKFDVTRPFFLRPSFIYFFTELWHEDRDSFWNLFNELLQDTTKEVQLFVRLVLFGVIASEYETAEDLRPLLELNARYESSFLIKTLLQSIRFIRSSTLAQDGDLLLLLADQLHPAFIFDYGFLLDRAVSHARTGRELEKAGISSRRFLQYILMSSPEEKRYMDRLGSTRGVELVAKTFASDPTDSKRVLSLIFNMLENPGYEIWYFSSLSDHVKLILPQDPVFVAKVYEVIFGHTESSEERTSMGASVIMNFTSSRRQDFEMCYYRLEELFPEFLALSPLLAIPIGLKISNDYVINEKLSRYGLLEPEVFDYKGKSCQYLKDLSSIWSDNLHYHKPAGLAFRIVEFIDAKLASGANVDQLIETYIDHAKVGFTWKLLFKLGAKYPAQLAGHLFELVIVPYLLRGADTSYEARDFIEKAVSFLSDEQVKRIEEKIFEVYPENNHLITQALSRIPAERMQLDKSREHRVQFGSAKNEPVVTSHTSVETYTTNMWLQDRGGDLSNPGNQHLTRLSDQLEVFNSEWLNNVPPAEIYETKVSVAKETFDRLTEQQEHIAPDLFYSVLREVTKCCAIIARNTDLDKPLFTFIQRVILYSFRFHSAYDLSMNDDSSPSQGYSPTPRIEAAEAILRLFLQEQSSALRTALIDAVNDKNGIVRFNAIREISNLAELDFSLYYELIVQRLKEETDAFTYAALVGNLFLQKGRENELADEYLRIIEPKESFFGWHNSFIEQYTNTLLWLLRRHHHQTAKKILLQAFKRPELCRTIIFTLFDRIHPSYPENDFINHPHLFQEELQIVREYVQSAGAVFKQIKPEDLQQENATIKAAFQIIDEIVLRIYFAFDGKKIARSSYRLPVKEENRRAFYFQIKPIYQDIIHLSSFIGDRGIITGHTAHYFISTLNKIVQYDPKDVLSMVTEITNYAVTTGYTFDSYAIQEVVRLTERLLADYRNLLLDDKSFSELITLLDMYINSGWVDALELLWKLDEVFK